MSRLLVTQYQAEVEKIIRYGGSRNESSIRNAFERLLNDYCKPRNYMLIPELEYKTKLNKPVRPDGTVKDAIRLEHGWWESKDKYDVLDKEIEYKFAQGYPDENILFEDSKTAVLIQHGREQMRVSMKDAEALDRLITTFVDYERPEVRDFRTAIAKFRDDIPYILEALRGEIQKAERENKQFRQRRNTFLEVCRQSINPEIEIFDIHEMLIQHILTEDIFTNIFHESQFHRENNIAREIGEILDTFFTGATRRNTLKSIEHYYAVIRRKSENIANHHEKQKFLKAVYENFYKAYNPKAADRLGIVYTPNEIVRFMIESADYLTHKHFGKLLSDSGVEILDPCTGTGTYVTELIEYLPPDKLEHKYKREIHCNEVAILPYYIANLNIEFTYQQKMGKYEEFKNICLVDTLDHCTFNEQQLSILALSVQNTTRIQEQNTRTISVIIGNPPYNAWQEEFSQNNPNRLYKDVDKRIKATYIKQGTAQNQNAVYDMYTRFYRWATDRLSEQLNDGIVIFVTNNSFIKSNAFIGFRRCIQTEFDCAYIIDLGGDVRQNTKLSGTKNNVFGIQVGVAIMFLVRNSTTSQQNIRQCKIRYLCRPEMETAEDKLQFISENQIQSLSFKNVQFSSKGKWLVDEEEEDFDSFLDLIHSDVKSGDKREAVFKLFSRGVETNRDEWVFDFNRDHLSNKVRFFIDQYNESLETGEMSPEIKWNSSLVKHFNNGVRLVFNGDDIIPTIYRPFTQKYLYANRVVCHRLTQNHYEIFGRHLSQENFVIAVTNHTQVSFSVQVFKCVSEVAVGRKTGQCLPLYRYDEDGNRIDNITDWGLTQFQTHYDDSTITKLDIFHYTYAVLHHPAYCSKYEINLKPEFPRLPFYPNFHQWATWGRDLMELHLNYETAEPYALQRIDGGTKPIQGKARQDTIDQTALFTTTPSPLPLKPKIKAEESKGRINLDTDTFLVGVPALAWDYKLGDRSALEWILDQYKEKKPRDPTICEKFNTYKFADYKDHVIDLLQRVCTVSVRTMEIIQQMPDTVEHQKD